VNATTNREPPYLLFNGAAAYLEELIRRTQETLARLRGEQTKEGE